MEYAVIRFGGKQFKVSKGDKITLERQSDPSCEVLMYSKDTDTDEVKIGMPVLEDIIVELEKIEDTRGKKIRVGRFKSKSRHRKVKGHKQPISGFEVVKIGKPTKKTPSAKASGQESEKKPKKTPSAKASGQESVEKPKKRGRPKKVKKGKE